MHNLLKTVYKTAYGYPYSERQTSELLKQMILVKIFFFFFILLNLKKKRNKKSILMVKFIQIMIFDNESELINIFQFYIIIIKKKKK